MNLNFEIAVKVEEHVQHIFSHLPHYPILVTTDLDTIEILPKYKTA